MAAEAKDSECKDSINDILYEEDDNDQFSTIDAENIGSAPSSAKGLNIDLSLAASASYKPSLEDRIEQEANTPVRVLFDLPDGSQVEQDFQLGQTIEVLKSFLCVEYGIPMLGLELFLECGIGPLLDPMSLSDYPQVTYPCLVCLCMCHHSHAHARAFQISDQSKGRSDYSG
jgi:hypothetical protein